MAASSPHRWGLIFSERIVVPFEASLVQGAKRLFSNFTDTTVFILQGHLKKLF